jgi:DnaJ-class molecular chaperone
MEHRKYVVTPTGPNRYENNYIDSCRNCLGSGFIIVEAEGTCRLTGAPERVITCDVCGGSGEVSVTKKIEVIVKPFLKSEK